MKTNTKEILRQTAITTLTAAQIMLAIYPIGKFIAENSEIPDLDDGYFTVGYLQGLTASIALFGVLAKVKEDLKRINI